MREVIALGPADALPKRLMYILDDRLHNDQSLVLDVHYMHGTPNLKPLENMARLWRVNLFCYFAGAYDRDMMARGVPVNFVPCAFRDIGAAMLAAGVTDLYHMGRINHNNRQISFGSCCGYSKFLIDNGVYLHLEDNPNLPYTGPTITSYSCSGISYQSPIHMHKKPKVSDVDIAIAKHIIDVMPPNPVIQVGVGGVPNTVLALMVEKMLPVKRIVSELFSPAMIPLIEWNLLEGDVECTIAFGDSPEFYRFLEHNRHIVKILPVEETNNSERLAGIPNLVSINSCLEIDYYGQVNSEQVNGVPYSGSGGQLDFVLGATRSPGGMSFLCMPSKRVDKKTGEIRSRIVERLHGVVTVPRNCVDWVVTEKGAVRLRGLSQDARRDALLSIA